MLWDTAKGPLLEGLLGYIGLVVLALAPHACVAAFAAAGGRNLRELGNRDEESRLPSLPLGLSVLSIRPFFSGEGVRESFCGAEGPGEREAPVGGCSMMFF